LKQALIFTKNKAGSGGAVNGALNPQRSIKIIFLQKITIFYIFLGEI